jgi:hypothetical protein
MSKVGIVTDRGTSQKGKATIHIDNQLYYAGNTDLGTLTVGDQVEFDASSFADGKLWGINKGWKLVKGVNKYAPSSTPVQTPIAAPALPAPATGLFSVGDAERPCVSNWGAVLLAEKLADGTPRIKDPADLGIWVQAILHALRGN